MTVNTYFSDGFLTLDIYDITGDIVTTPENAVKVAEFVIEHKVERLNFDDIEYINPIFYRKLIECLLDEINKR